MPYTNQSPFGAPQSTLGSQVNNWVNQSAQSIPALHPPAATPPVTPAVTPPGTPAAPGAAPSVALPATTPSTTFPLNPGAMPPQGVPQHQRHFGENEQLPHHFENWQARLTDFQQRDPERYARMLPMIQQMMQRRGLQFPQQNAVMPNPTPVV